MSSYHPENDPSNPDPPGKDGRSAKEDPAEKYDGVNPNPGDEAITGLEPGGGVPPGETPPAAAQTGVDRGRED